MKIKSNLRILTNVKRDDVFNFLQAVASIRRSDVIKAFGNRAFRLLETAERTGIVKTSKVSNAKVYHISKTIDMAAVKANKSRAMVIQAFRDNLELKIGDPVVLSDTNKNWLVCGLATTKSIFKFKLIYTDINTTRLIKADNAAVPIYIVGDGLMISDVIKLPLVNNTGLIATTRGKSEVELNLIIKDNIGQVQLVDINEVNRDKLLKLARYGANSNIINEISNKYKHKRYEGIKPVDKRGGSSDEA